MAQYGLHVPACMQLQRQEEEPQHQLAHTARGRKRALQELSALRSCMLHRHTSVPSQQPLPAFPRAPPPYEKSAESAPHGRPADCTPQPQLGYAGRCTGCGTALPFPAIKKVFNARNCTHCALWLPQKVEAVRLSVSRLGIMERGILRQAVFSTGQGQGPQHHLPQRGS